MFWFFQRKYFSVPLMPILISVFTKIWTASKRASHCFDMKTIQCKQRRWRNVCCVRKCWEPLVRTTVILWFQGLSTAGSGSEANEVHPQDILWQQWRGGNNTPWTWASNPRRLLFSLRTKAAIWWRKMKVVFWSGIRLIPEGSATSKVRWLKS